MEVCARFILPLILLLFVGCRANQNRELDFVYATVTLPAGFRHEWEPGDSPRGRMLSRDGKTVIAFDLGFCAGTYANPKTKGQIWFRKGVAQGIPYQISLETWTRRKTLFVTFPDFGPANFWADVETEADIDRMTKMILELKPRKTQKSERKA